MSPPAELLLLPIAVALVAAAGVTLGMLLAPAIGRWAVRRTDGDDDE